MKSNLKIELFNKKYLDQVIKLISESDHTDRTIETWRHNSMTAILAFEKNLLIGAIPFEQHRIKISLNEYISGLWVSAAYVKPTYRSLGIGSLLDSQINKLMPEKDIVMVMRHDEGTNAYRWYVKNRYRIISEVISMKIPILLNNIKFIEDYQIIKSNQVSKYATELLEIFENHNSKKINYPERTLEFWENKMLFHYYKQSYKFYIILTTLDSGLKCFALLGETSIRDNIPRIDILEISCPSNKKDIKNLFDKIQHFSNKIDIKEVRVQLAKYDELKDLAINYGFVERWKTNLMSKRLNKNILVQKNKTRFFQIDYI